MTVSFPHDLQMNLYGLHGFNVSNCDGSVIITGVLLIFRFVVFVS